MWYSVVVIAVAFVGYALAQATHTIPAYGYLGCSEVNLTCFELAPILVGTLQPEECEQACSGSKYAALFWE